MGQFRAERESESQGPTELVAGHDQTRTTMIFDKVSEVKVDQDAEALSLTT